MHIYYVYSYLREKDSTHGKAGTPYYIGKGKNKRAYEKHKGIAVPKDHQRIVFHSVNLTEEQAFILEKSLIENFGRIDLSTGCLRNLTDGGQGGTRHRPKFTDEWRKKMSLAKIGTKRSKETCEKIAKAVRNSPEEVKRKRRENNIGVKRKPRTEAHRANMSTGIRNSKKVMSKITELGKISRGSRWFYHPETLEVIKVYKEHIQIYENNGYVLGRKPKAS